MDSGVRRVPAIGQYFKPTIEDRITERGIERIIHAEVGKVGAIPKEEGSHHIRVISEVDLEIRSWVRRCRDGNGGTTRELTM